MNSAIVAAIMKILQKRFVSQIFRNLTKQKSQIQSMALRDAETLVGYSFTLRQKWLENDEIKIKDIITRISHGADTCFLENMQRLLLNDYHLHWGLIILLIAKAAGSSNPLNETDSNAEFLDIQRSTAEVGEMLHFMKILHSEVQILSDQSNRDTFRNNLYILVGNILLADSFREFASWKRADAMEIICSGIRDITENAFMEPTDSFNRFIPAKPKVSSEDIKMSVTVPYLGDSESLVNLSNSLGIAMQEWVARNQLEGANLLSKCCQAALLVGNHPKQLQISAHILGSNLVLAHQASMDYFKFLDDDNSSFSLVSAPLLFHLQDNPDYYEVLLEITRHQSIDYEGIKKNVKLGDGLNKTRKLVDDLATNAIKVLEDFPDNEAKIALRNIIMELRNVTF